MEQTSRAGVERSAIAMQVYAYASRGKTSISGMRITSPSPESIHSAERRSRHPLLAPGALLHVRQHLVDFGQVLVRELLELRVVRQSAAEQESVVE